MDRHGAALTRSGQLRPNRLSRGLQAALVAPPLVFLAVFYAWPFATLLARGLDLDVAGDILGRRQTWEVVWFTTWQALASTALTLLAGFAPAYVIARFEFAGRRLLASLLMAVFVLPTVVVAAAFLALLPDSLDRSVWAILAAHVTFNLAVVVRTVGAVWEHLPPDLEAAAATLGASPARVVREITLPLLRPALVAAATIVFLFTFTSFGVVRVLGDAGTTTLEVEVWRQATQLGEIDAAAVLTVLQLLVLGVVVVWSAVLQRRFSRALALRPRARRRRPRAGPQRRLVVAVAGLTGLVVLVPLGALVERSTRASSGHSLDAWTNLGDVRQRRGASVSVDPLDALRSSLQAALLATLIAVVIGGIAALAIASAERGGRLLDAGLMLPLGTSAVTIGFGMLITFDTPPVDWRAEPWIVPVGHALVAIPFVVRSTLGVLRSVDPKLSDAAATLGASPSRAWRAVVVPHLWRPLVVGAGLAAAISLGEFGATSFLSRRDTETVPVAIEKLLSRTGAALQARGYVLAVILAVATVVVVTLVDWEANVLDVRDVTVRFATRDGGARTVLDAASLTVGLGEVVGLLGPSGSGKSTLLRVIAGLHQPDAGSVWIDGEDVTATPTHRRDVGMVFQDEQLFPHRTVEQNVEFGLRMRGVDGGARRARVGELLELVGLDGFGARQVTDLSGGEAKRVALARSLAPRPRVLLLDEPLAGLDRELHDRLAADVASILRTEGTTALLVTHDAEEAAAIADRVVALGSLSSGR